MAAYSNLGIYLKQKRDEAGLTQAGLALELGNVLAQFVSNWERGLCAPPSHSLPKLMTILDLDKKTLVEVMVKDSKAVIERKIFSIKRTDNNLKKKRKLS